MVSLINKQLLLTAYAYLFIMEQQKAQQGGEALQLQVESTAEQIQEAVARAFKLDGADRDAALSDIRKTYDLGLANSIIAQQVYEWRKALCEGVKNHAAMPQWLVEHQAAWDRATSLLDKHSVLAEMKADFVEAINSVPKLEKRYAALVKAADSWGFTLDELIAEGTGLGNMQVGKDGLPTMQQCGETDGGLAEEWRRSCLAKSEDSRRTNPRITYNSIGAENLSPYLEKVKILELMQLAMLQKLWKSTVSVENGIPKLRDISDGTVRKIPERFTEYKKVLHTYLPGQIELMKQFIEKDAELQKLEVRKALHFATCGQEEKSCRVCHK